jgi:hypothetical protein
LTAVNASESRKHRPVFTGETLRQARVVGDVEKPDHDGLIRSNPDPRKLSWQTGGTGAAMKTAALAAGMMAMAAAGEAQTHKGYEMPPYRVEAAEGARELRLYGPHVLAEVRVSGDRGAAISTGFSMLAGYIFGGNAARQRIAMTVPVTQTDDGAFWTVSFMMPAGFTPESLPAPNDNRIRFVTAPGGRQVAERFSGRPDTADMAARAAALRQWAEARGLTVTDGPHYQFYDAPMTLPGNRRNEVAWSVR